MDRGAAARARDGLRGTGTILPGVPTEELQLTDRVARVRARLADDGLDALVVTGQASIR